MPWRNGGGITTEIAISPTDLGPSERFLYRVSIADVATDGRFSLFEGYDRHIMLLSGTGMTLGCGEHGSIALRPFVPRTFSGDWEVHGTLESGAVRDFNLIVDRARAVGTLDMRWLEDPETISCAADETCILHMIEGHADGADAGDTLVADGPFDLVPHGPVRVAIARVVRITSRSNS